MFQFYENIMGRKFSHHYTQYTKESDFYFLFGLELDKLRFLFIMLSFFFFELLLKISLYARYARRFCDPLIGSVYF